MVFVGFFSQNENKKHPAIMCDLTLQPSRVYSFLMWYCMSAETSSKKSPKLRKLLRCNTMVLLSEGSLFFTSTTFLLCLWWSMGGPSGLLGTYWWWTHGAHE